MGHSSLVTDETMIDLIRDEINNNKECRNGYISAPSANSATPI